MDVPISYEEALARHPAEVAAILRDVRRGKAKDKDRDAATWKWTYSWGTRIDGGISSLADLLSGKHEPWPVKLARMTLDERVADEVSRSKPVHLVGRTPSFKTRGWADMHPDYFPPEAEALIREGHASQVAEQARVAGLTQEQRDAEVRGALEYLMGPKNRGFVALRVAPSSEIDGTVDSETWSATTNPPSGRKT